MKKTKKMNETHAPHLSFLKIYSLDDLVGKKIKVEFSDDEENEHLFIGLITSFTFSGGTLAFPSMPFEENLYTIQVSLFSRTDGIEFHIAIGRKLQNGEYSQQMYFYSTDEIENDSIEKATISFL